ncbi:MAG: alanine racemase [Pseudomonadota bacterium]
MRDTWLTLNPHALTQNLAVLRAHHPRSQVIAMVKADAYGHGVAAIAPLLQDQTDALGVAFLDEALALRAMGINCPIAVLEGVFSATELAAARGADLQLAVHSPEQMALLQTAPMGPSISVWLKLNTGMNRLGFRPAEALAIWRQLKGLSVVGRISLMTHFSRADELSSNQTELQWGRFTAVRDALSLQQGGPLITSVANSAAILAWPQTQSDWMRPGIALYGSSPFADQSAQSFGLQPVMTLHSRVIAVHELQAGDEVGYGATWVADAPTRIAVVAIGYGDGYPRHARNGTPVLVNGQRCALAGRVSMDMITVDLGAVPAQPGDAVVLWGDGLPADEVAQAAGTISYELFCRLTPRVRRVAPCLTVSKHSTRAPEEHGPYK